MKQLAKCNQFQAVVIDYGYISDLSFGSSLSNEQEASGSAQFPDKATQPGSAGAGSYNRSNGSAEWSRVPHDWSGSGSAQFPSMTVPRAGGHSQQPSGSEWSEISHDLSGHWDYHNHGRLTLPPLQLHAGDAGEPPQCVEIGASASFIIAHHKHSPRFVLYTYICCGFTLIFTVFLEE